MLNSIRNCTQLRLDSISIFC